MSIVVNVNGESINYPQTGDTNWGDETTDFAVQTSSALAKVGLSTGTTVDLPGTLDVTGNTTLDANLSVGGTTSLTGIVNVDSGVLYVDPVNNRVGINKTNPTQALDVSGNALVSGTLGVSNGTAGLPSITPSGDTNTGIYSIGADKIGFSANGARVGEFGIGYGGFIGNIIQVRNSSWNTTISTTGTLLTGHKLSITPKYSNSILLFFLSANVGNNLAGNWGYVRIKNNTDSNYVSLSLKGTYNSNGQSYVHLSIIDTLTLSNVNTKEFEIELSSAGGTAFYCANGYYSNLIIMELQQ